MAQKCRQGEKRQPGWLYFVKGDNLEVWRARMARGGKRKKKAKKKKAKKRKVKRKKPKKRKRRR